MSDKAIYLVLPWPPTVNTYWRYVNGRVLISRAGRAYRKAVALIATSKDLVPFNGVTRLAVTLYAYPPDRRKRDLDNLFKSVLDSLQHAEVIADDGLIDDLRIVRQCRMGDGQLTVTIKQAEPIDGDD